ncbi:MAG: HRDC domain-containing protein [Kofleriaceae bacterium]
MTALLAEPPDVAAIAAAIAKSPLVTFDLEFLTQDRLVPTLCLVQVSWLPPEVRLDVPTQVIVATPPAVVLVDALAVDLRPLIEALAAHPLVVVHAARQDLGILAAQFGIAMPRIIDTQVMAAFAGIGDQVGLANLANDLLGLTLGKEQQWTDWARRPLSDAQLAYADADVRHLPAIYALLAQRLGERIEWARAESSQVAADAVAAASVTPETAWRTSRLRGLDAATLAAVKVLAAWRQRIAIEHDRPLPQVMNDKALVDVARQRPGSPEGVRAVKTVSPFARKYADAIVLALATARPNEVAVIRSHGAPSARAQRWSEMLIAITQLIAEQIGVAPRLLATRADTEELARAIDERGIAAADELPAMQTWRRDVIGKRWIGWLTGDLALVGDLDVPSGLALRAR